MRYLVSALVAMCFLSCFSLSEGIVPPRAMQEAFPQGENRDFERIPLQHVLTAAEPYEEPTPVKIACPSLPAPAATADVNALKPGHIKVIMSMGDSITAAMSAKDTNVLNLKEYRGISYAIGGDNNVTTMANLLKPYTTGLIGQAVGIGQRTATAVTGFNAAVSGALNVDMLGQAEWLITQVKAHKSVNLTADWKLLTIWIGSNNLCAVCKNKAANDADDYEKRLTEALDLLHKSIPRLFVNLVSNLDVSRLNNFTSGACGSLHLYECGCTSSNAALVAATTKEYQARSLKIASNYNARKDPEFAVVVQPFLTNSIIFNRLYLSAADCFHPSAICHQAISIALWNSMITPVAQKKLSFDENEPVVCATADSLLYTK